MRRSSSWLSPSPAFGDFNQHRSDVVYTRPEMGTARWPSEIKEGGRFVISVME